MNSSYTMRSFDNVTQRDGTRTLTWWESRASHSRIRVHTHAYACTLTHTRARPQVRGHVATCLLGRPLFEWLRTTDTDCRLVALPSETNERTNEPRTVQRPFNPALTFASRTHFSWNQTRSKFSI